MYCRCSISNVQIKTCNSPLAYSQACQINLQCCGFATK
jgi:hypothetical protein